MISVIVPVYNAEQYLNRCIDSILNSSYQDFEIILINDGSTDNSFDICQKYHRQDPRIRLISQENQGVSAARNRGLDASNGKWILFIDSDDFISSEFLGIAARKEYQNTELLLFEFTQTGKKLTSDNLTLKTAHYCEKNMIQLIKRILVPAQLPEGGNTNFRSPCARVYRKSVIDQYSIRFSDAISIGEDLLFNMEYQLRIHSCVYIQKPVYYYNIHPGSASHSFNPGLMENHIKLQKRIKDTLEKYSVFPLLEKEFYSYSLENMTYVLIREIFNPHSPRAYRQNCQLCKKMQKNKIYRQAIKYNRQCGILPRRILIFFFLLKCYPAVYLICQISYRYLEKQEFS